MLVLHSAQYAVVRNDNCTARLLRCAGLVQPSWLCVSHAYAVKAMAQGSSLDATLLRQVVSSRSEVHLLK